VQAKRYGSERRITNAATGSAPTDAAYHEDRTPTHGYAETREAAMAAFAKSWRRE